MNIAMIMIKYDISRIAIYNVILRLLNIPSFVFVF